MDSILTVTAAADDRSLLTVAEWRTAIGNEAIPQATAKTQIARVSQAIVHACRIASAGAAPPTLRLETLSEQFRLAAARRQLLLARRPVTDILGITENDTELADDDYEIDAGAALLMRLSSDVPAAWPSGKIVVSYRAGWSVVPDDLKLAAAKLAAVLWSEGARGDPSLKRVRVEGVSEREWWVGPTDDPLIPREIMDLLYAGGYVDMRVT